MDHSELGVTRSAREIRLVDVLVLLVTHLRLLVVLPLAVGLIALAVSFQLQPVFVATTRILPPSQQNGAAMLAQQLGSLAGFAGAAAGLKNPADQYVALIQSTTVAKRMIERMGLMDVYKSQYLEDAIKTLDANTTTLGGKDGLIKIEVSDTDPVRAAAIANAYVIELRRLTGELAISEASQRRVFFEGQLAATRDALVKAETALAGSRVSEDLLKSEPRVAVEAIARLKAMTTAAEVRLSVMGQSMTSANPDYQVVQQELASLRAQLKRADTAEPAGSSPDYIAKYREVRYQQMLFELLARQFELARVDEGREGVLIQVVDAAIAPDRKAKPKKAMIAIAAALIAGMLTLLFVFLRHGIVESMRVDPEFRAKVSVIRRLLWRRSRA